MDGDRPIDVRISLQICATSARLMDAQASGCPVRSQNKTGLGHLTESRMQMLYALEAIAPTTVLERLQVLAWALRVPVRGLPSLQ